MQEEVYNRHRFDNYTAWLDRADKQRAQSNGRPLGWGYCEPKPPGLPREERPFSVLEQGFTSGQLLVRKYDQLESNFRTEANRADPWHYPNEMNLKDEHHYGDHRRRSCHPDPSRWKKLPGDAILQDAVSENQVKERITAEKGERRRPAPADMLELLFSENSQDAPARENPAMSSRSAASNKGSPAQTKKRWALSGTEAPPIPPPEPPEGGHGMPPRQVDEGDPARLGKWGWCLGSRPSKVLGRSSPQEQELIKSRSLPVVLPGQSMLTGNIGGQSGAFHGLNTRKFGTGTWDGRMRGGQLARDGWAGTFPSREARPG